VMMNILSRHIKDDNVLWLIRKVIESFNSPPIVHSSYQSQRIEGRGLPLGNLTSQLLVNIYMNEFDQYVKHSLKIRHYIRYADDFVIFHSDKHELVAILGKIEIFLIRTLRLSLHPNKVFIKTVSSGLDFLGWIHFPHHRILRTTTKRRMLKNVVQNDMKQEIKDIDEFAD
jgi:retron-type reverse transcriptase